MKIDYRIIPHTKQRYPTAGDYWWDEDTLHIRVSQLKEPLHEYLIFVHELIEATLVREDGAPDESTIFDMPYELARKAGIAAPCGCVPTEDSEPGDDVHSPYYREHHMATMVEQMLCWYWDLRWDEYGEEVSKLDAPVAKDSNAGVVQQSREKRRIGSVASRTKSRQGVSRKLSKS